MSFSQKAPWRDQFLSHVSKMKAPSFTFSSINISKGHPQPRSRTCVYRGLWAEIPDDERNTAERNEDVYSSDLPMFTTDVRMEKAKEIITSAPDTGKDVDVTASGGGGPIEALWWIEETGTQWRIRGDAWVINDADIDSDSEAATKVRKTLEARMRVTNGTGGKEWSWRREVGVVFGAQSPGIKGSFRGPPPGKPVGEIPEGNDGPGTKLDDINDKTARENFRVIVIRPSEVEVIDLSDPEKARRQFYTYQDDGSWTHETLWP